MKNTQEHPGDENPPCRVCIERYTTNPAIGGVHQPPVSRPPCFISLSLQSPPSLPHPHLLRPLSRMYEIYSSGLVWPYGSMSARK